MTLAFESLTIPFAGGVVLATYLAEPGTPSADALELLRSWTSQPIETTTPADRTN